MSENFSQQSEKENKKHLFNEDEQIQKEEILIQQKMNELNNELSKFSLISQKFGLDSSSEEPSPENQLENEQYNSLSNLPTINKRGIVILDNQTIHDNYNNSLPILRIMQLPFCYQSLKKKFQFWTVASILGGIIYQAKLKVERREKIRSIQIRPIMRSSGFIFLMGMSFSFIESFFFDEYCDINSYHYSKDISKSQVLKELKKKLGR